ncbi:hypothetical protein ONZ45_g2045 [Pleurotus djamor]|nr:hypothetical protein ONZ45_g2045 [Pleurotus djamor]
MVQAYGTTKDGAADQHTEGDSYAHGDGSGESSALLGGESSAQTPHHSQHEGHASIGSCVSNLANTIIGSGMLTFPLAMASAGLVPGMITCVFSGSVAAFGLYLLSLCAAKAPHRRSSFFAVSQLTFPKAAVFFDAAIAIKCFGVSISYLIIIKGLMPNVVASLYHDLTSPDVNPPDWALSGQNWITLFMLVLVPLCFLRKLDSLRHTSYIALFSVAYLIIIVITCYFHPLKGSPEPGEVRLIHFTPNFVSTFPVQVFAFTCAQNLFPIYNELASNTQARMNTVIGTSIGSATLTYEIIGIFGYLTFGSKVGANIVAMYPSTSLFIAVGQLAIVILVLFSYPLQVHPCRNCLDKVFHAGELAASSKTPSSEDEDEDEMENLDELPSPDMTPLKHTVLTAAIIAFGFTIAYFVDDLRLVLSFVGSTGSTTISFILPGLFYWKLTRNDPTASRSLNKAALGLSLYGALGFVYFTMSLVEKSIPLASPEILTASSAPNSRLSSPPVSSVDLAVGVRLATSTSSSSVISSVSSGLSASSSAGSILVSGDDSSGRRSPSWDRSASSDILSRPLSLAGGIDGQNASSNPNQPNEPDAQILEALKSKDRLYVLKLGELMEGLINDRRNRIETNPATTYQRLLVHRCSAYYGLRPETDSVTKAIYVCYTSESRIPTRRVRELVPAENKFQPAFKIMSRAQLNSKSKPHSHASSVAGEDNDPSDIEPSEAGSLGGRSNAAGGAKKRPTIEEREAAYNEARSRIFMDFQEKEKEKGISASSSTASLVSGSGSTSGGGRSSASDGDEVLNSPVTESEQSAPVVREREKQRRGGSKRGSGNNSVASSSRSLRSAAPPYSGSGPSSSRGSGASSPSMVYSASYDPGHNPGQYDPAYHMPYSGTSPGSEYAPHIPYTYQPYPPPPGQPQYYPYAPPYYPPYPYPPPQGHPSEPPSQSPPNPELYGTHSPVPPMSYGHPPYGWPPNNMPPPHLQQPPPPPMGHPQHPLQSPPQGPNPLPPPFPHHGASAEHPSSQLQNQPYGYMQAPYPYPSPYYPPSHPHPPPMPPPMYPPRPGNSLEPNGPNIPDHASNGHMYHPGNMSGNSSNGSVNHSRASSRSSMGSTLGNGGKGRTPAVPPLTRGPWSYGPGPTPSGYQQPINNAPGNDAFGPRLSGTRRMSNNSMSSSGYTSRDEVSSTASSSTSSSSRRTYTSTNSSQQHPLPARPDWAVGLKPQPTLASSSSNRKVSPVSPHRGPSSNGASRQQPVLQSADFPPLSNSDREARAPAVAGAWTDSSPIRTLVQPQRGPPTGPNPIIINHNQTDFDDSNMNMRLADTERGFERPPPKGSAELYNPKLPRKSMSPSSRQQSQEESPSSRRDAFVAQMNTLSLNDRFESVNSTSQAGTGKC